MIYLKTSRKKFIKELRAQNKKNYTMYYQWYDLRSGIDLKYADQTMNEVVQRMKEVFSYRNEQIVRGSLKFGYYPSKWLGYRCYTRSY